MPAVPFSCVDGWGRVGVGLRVRVQVMGGGGGSELGGRQSVVEGRGEG